MNVLLKSAMILAPDTPEYHKKRRDILVKNGRIEKIAATIKDAGKARTILLPNLHVSPGWFDSSVCFGEPGFEERETIQHGLKIAAASGFTDIVLQPNTNPLPDTSSDIVFLKKLASGHACALHPLGTLTQGSKGNDLAELYDMHNAGAVGFYDHKKPLSHANVLKIALQYTSNFGGLVHSFPMDEDLSADGVAHEGVVSTRLGLKGIPNLAEEMRIARDLYLLEYAGGKLHIPTLSTAGAVALITAAKNRGLDVSCSVSLHQIWGTDETLASFDSHFKVLPPLRTEKDRKALRDGLRNGTIDMVTSDHTPLDVEEKRVEFSRAAFGSLGLEESFGVLNSIFATNTAVGILIRGRERFGMETPRIKKGEAANLTLFDPDVRWTYDLTNCHSTSKNSMYFESRMKGKVYGVIAHNKIAI